MKLAEIRIQNFRTFRDETIRLDDYACMVGPNGCGKSTVLTALNIFFRNTVNAVTDLVNLTDEDFHRKDTSRPITITAGRHGQLVATVNVLLTVGLSAEINIALRHNRPILQTLTFVGSA